MALAKLKAASVLRIAIVVIALLVSSGCSSSLVLGKLYDGFGSNTAKRFKSFATFDEAEVKIIDAYAASYHSWHRTTQLDRYAEFMRLIVADVESSDELSISTADSWLKSVREFSDEMRACNPLNVAAELLSNLSDTQVSQVAARMRKELNKREDEFRAQTPQERQESQVKEITKWGKRSGFGFNEAQTAALRETLQTQISLGSQRYEIRRVWMEEFILFLAERDQPQFDKKITDHIANAWSITEDAFPEQWNANEKLWTAFMKDFINLQTRDQRLKMISKMTAVGKTLEKLADKNTSAEAICHQR